jgi:glutamate synthase (NADPH/NADH) small chain
MDCLRTALRTGARDALCAYRRDLENMPGSRKEYANALEEGARFQFLTCPVGIETNAEGVLYAVRCVRMALGEPDAQGRRSPRPVTGSEFSIPADFVLIAYGFDAVPFPPESDFRQVAVNKWGTFEVNGDQMTNLPGVYAGGDSVRGPSLVVHAVRDARRAAASIHRSLAGRT